MIAEGKGCVLEPCVCLKLHSDLNLRVMSKDERGVCLGGGVPPSVSGMKRECRGPRAGGTAGRGR